MPTTTRQSNGPSSSIAELIWLMPEDIRPNPWNPNVIPADLLARARESLLQYGWLAPVVVRLVNGGYELVDGEHRWQIAKEEHLGPIPAYLVDLTDAAAKKATIILNDLHGQARPDKLAALLRDLIDTTSLEEIVIGLPYDAETIGSLLPDLDLPSLPVGPLPTNPSPEGARWVERTYRMPLDAAAVLDDALIAARGSDDIEPWQALERLAAEFLAS